MHKCTHTHTLTGRWQRIMKKFLKKKQKKEGRTKKRAKSGKAAGDQSGGGAGRMGTGAAGSLTTSCKRIKSKNSLKLCWPCIKCNSMQADPVRLRLLLIPILLPASGVGFQASSPVPASPALFLPLCQRRQDT